MTLDEFMTKYRLSGRATARILRITEGTVRHWLTGVTPVPAGVLLLIRLLDDYRTRLGRWPEA